MDSIINNKKIIVLMEVISILLIVPIISSFILAQPTDIQNNSIHLSNQNEDILSPFEDRVINKIKSSQFSHFAESISSPLIFKEKKEQLEKLVESKEYKLMLKQCEFTNINKGRENIINIIKSQIQKQEGIFNDTVQDQNYRKVWYLDTKNFEA